MAYILVVDDEDHFLETISMMVAELEHTAIQAKSGNAALSYLKKNPDIQVVISDLVMPNGTGQELLEGIRNTESLKHIPVILLSDKLSMKDIEELLHKGATYFLPKPARLGALAEYLERALERHVEDNGS